MAGLPVGQAHRQRSFISSPFQRVMLGKDAALWSIGERVFTDKLERGGGPDKERKPVYAGGAARYVRHRQGCHGLTHLVLAGTGDVFALPDDLQIQPLRPVDVSGAFEDQLS